MKNYDTIVIGAGIAGLSVARELAKMKQRVLVLEKDVKGGQTSRAAAGIIDPYTEAKEETPLFRLGLQAFDLYPSFLQELGEKVTSYVEFEKMGVLYLALKQEDEDYLNDRLPWQKKQEIPVQPVSAEKIRRMEPGVSKKVRNGVFYPEISKLNAAKLTEAVLQSTQAAGVEIKISQSDVSVWEEKDKVRGVHNGGQKIESGTVVLAAGCWSGLDQKLGLKIKVHAVRGQIFILKAGTPCPTHILHTTRYAYIVPWPNNRLLVGSTLESNIGFENKVTPEGKEDILNRASEILEEIRSLPIETSWAGLRPFADPGMPLIGPTPIKGLFLATGYYRSGILISPLVGKLLAQGITSGNFSPLLEPFYLELSPDRHF